MQYIIKAKFLGLSKPPVWRRLRVPGNKSFGEFNYALEDAFGWGDFHMHMFTLEKRPNINSICIGRPDPEGVLEVEEEDMLTVGSVFCTHSRLFWHYDFGNAWIIELKLEACNEDSDDEDIELLASKGDAPPED